MFLLPKLRLIPLPAESLVRTVELTASGKHTVQSIAWLNQVTYCKLCSKLCLLKTNDLRFAKRERVQKLAHKGQPGNLSALRQYKTDLP
jgi:hypothetical protein